jgi:hypothetical protein
MISNQAISAKIESAKARLRKRLVSLDVSTVGLSEYNQRYLRSKIADIDTALHIYGNLLRLAFHRSEKTPEESTVVDYGGGSGVLSLLSKEFGVKTVVYIDIYDVSRQDATTLGKKIGLEIDHGLSGDVDALVEYAKRNSLSVDGLVSYDVLEHIYDITSHFQKLSSLPGNFRAVYGSGANIKNRWYVKAVTKQHNDAEFRDREKKWGHKDRDALRAYFDLRKEIIGTYAPQLTAQQVEQLARETRGLIKGDIERCVDEFRSKGKHSYVPDHPTNTCDPLTGNWCEHLMDQDWLKRKVEEAGFRAQIKPGSYPVTGNAVKKLKKAGVNTLINLIGTSSLFVSPYIMLCADKGTAQKR